jgi:SAM-dependent methyltransferase
MPSRREVLAAVLAPGLHGQSQSPMFADAEAYERFMGRWSRLLAPLLVDFARVPDSGRALDVGSGTGALAVAIARLRPKTSVVGIDPSDQYVAYARSTNPFPDRITYETGDAQAIRFAGAAFHASLSLLVFNFIPDARKALREVIRVTAPGGVVAAAVWEYGAGMRMLRVFWDAAVALDPAAAQADERKMPLCRQGELSRLWNEGGLTGIEERPLDITMRFDSFADYWDAFLLGQGPAGSYARKLPDDRKRALRAEAARRLALTDERSPFSLPGRAWAVRGLVPG